MTSSEPASNAPPREMSLSAFFPCHNEEGNIQRVVSGAAEVLDACVVDWEIIVVDDGSTDATGRLADRLAAGDPRIRTVHHERNLGYGCALRSGLAAAGKEYVFYTDGDGQFDLWELPRLLDHRDEAEIISGYRVNRQEGRLRRLNTALWGRLVQLVLGFRCPDVDAAFKLYRREIFDGMTLRSTGALIDAEIIARAVARGYRVLPVPVHHLPRRSGRPSGASPRVILRAFRELLAYAPDIRRDRA